jgi:hypothetical protein
MAPVFRPSQRQVAAAENLGAEKVLKFNSLRHQGRLSAGGSMRRPSRLPAVEFLRRAAQERRHD